MAVPTQTTGGATVYVGRGGRPQFVSFTPLVLATPPANTITHNGHNVTVGGHFLVWS